jgi:hypothetical protein
MKMHNTPNKGITFSFHRVVFPLDRKQTFVNIGTNTFLGVNKITRTTLTCLGNCFWENILKNILTKVFKKIFKNLEYFLYCYVEVYVKDFKKYFILKSFEPHLQVIFVLKNNNV